MEEWCSDWYDRYYYSNSPLQDPTGPESGSQRVQRGGSWSSLVRQCLSANRATPGRPAVSTTWASVLSIGHKTQKIARMLDFSTHTQRNNQPGYGLFQGWSRRSRILRVALAQRVASAKMSFSSTTSALPAPVPPITSTRPANFVRTSIPPVEITYSWIDLS